MKITAFGCCLVLLLAVGCSSGPSSSEEMVVPEREPEPEVRAPSEPDRNVVMSRLVSDLNDINVQLEAIEQQKKDLAAAPPSEDKISQMEEIGRQEAELNKRRKDLNLEISRLEGHAVDSDSALASMMEMDAEVAEEKALQERVKKQQEESLAAQLAKDEAALKAKKERMARDQETIGSAGADSEEVIFEEEWASVIKAVRKELQHYMKW